MSTIFVIWLTVGMVVLVVWAARLAVLGGILRKREVLRRDSYDGPPRAAPRVSVLIPAKDEEANIERCVTTLLGQDYPDFEVIVIDDRSTDGTAGILQQLLRNHGDRLRVITLGAIREGWFGKNNAMRAGLELARADWFLFTDADCRQVSCRTISMAMREVVDQKLDFLSVTPVLETKTAWERLTQPVCALVLMLWFLPNRVNDPTKKTAYANGAFMLMHRRCYEAIGGHERVKTEVNEDIHMARIAKASGQRLKVMENDGLYLTRMYRTVGESWRGWSRIFYGCLGSIGRLMLASLAVVFFALLPWISTPVAAVGRWTTEPGHAASWSWALAAWGSSLALMHVAFWRLYPVLKIPRKWSMTYPCGAFIVLGMLFSAMLKVTGATGTTWRGTQYRGKRRTHATMPVDAASSNEEVRATSTRAGVTEEVLTDG